MMNRWLFVVLALAYPGYVLAAPGELATLIVECEACHGKNGISVDADVPIIAGQPQPMIEKAHEQYKDLARPCREVQGHKDDLTLPPSSMCDVSIDLDTVAIEAISAHYAALEFVPAPQPFDEALAVTGASLHQMYCESCHPDGGKKPGFAGRLAGQWTPYLRRMFEEIEGAEILVPHIMEGKVSDFSDEEREALLNFWASQQ